MLTGRSQCYPTAVEAPGLEEPDPLLQEVDPKRLMCIILHVHGVSLLTVWTYLLSVQKSSASQRTQPLQLVMEKAGDKRGRSASPSVNPLISRLGPRSISQKLEIS